MKVPRLAPLLLVLLLAMAMLVLDWVLPQFRFLHSASAYLGVGLMTLGVCIVLVAAGLFRLRKTTLNPFGEPATVVQDGIYRFSRNPMYLGMLLTLAGFGIRLGNLPALLFAPLFAVIMARGHIVREEQMLDARFGEAYRAYCKRVRRWI